MDSEERQVLSIESQISELKEFAAKPSEVRSPAKSGTKNLKSSNPKGSLLPLRQGYEGHGAAGGRGAWGEFRPPYKFWAKSVRIFSNAHRLRFAVARQSVGELLQKLRRDEVRQGKRKRGLFCYELCLFA